MTSPVHEQMEGMWPSRFERIYYATQRKLAVLRTLPREARYFIQRGRRGYSDRDVWSLDAYLADVIAGSVTQLRRTDHGYPGMFDGPEPWEKILDEIVEGFSNAREPWDFHSPEQEAERKAKLDLAMDHFKKYFHSLWD